MTALKAAALRRLYQGLRFLLMLSPRAVCLAFGSLLGRGVYLIDKKHRRLTLENLKDALGDDLNSRDRIKTARRVFSHFGTVLTDLLKLSTMSTDRIRRLISLHGTENLENALAMNRGIILFSAHFGNWEIAPALVSRIARLHVIARPLDDPYFEEQLLNLRARFGAQVIPKKTAVRSVLRALRSQDMVAILADQNVLRSEGVFVDFFGRPTATTPSPALFHLRTGAPLLPIFCSLTRDRRYRVDIGPPVEWSNLGDFQANMLKITELCSKIIEVRIRDNPDQWLWFHNRWKTQPEKSHTAE